MERASEHQLHLMPAAIRAFRVGCSLSRRFVNSVICPQAQAQVSLVFAGPKPPL